jgi:hypothetical protein
LFSRLPLRQRNMDPAPFRHPVDVFSSFCNVVWQLDRTISCLRVN